MRYAVLAYDSGDRKVASPRADLLAASKGRRGTEPSQCSVHRVRVAVRYHRFERVLEVAFACLGDLTGVRRPEASRDVTKIRGTRC
jgi:hypothetical protein